MTLELVVENWYLWCLKEHAARWIACEDPLLPNVSAKATHTSVVSLIIFRFHGVEVFILHLPSWEFWTISFNAYALVRHRVDVWLWDVVTKAHLTFYLKKPCFESISYALWQLWKWCWIRHAKLVCLVDSLFNGVIVTEPLPLRIHWINTPTRKDTLLNKSLPVDLVFVFLAWVFLHHFEYVDEFSKCKPCSLPRELLDQLDLTLWVAVFARGRVYFHNDKRIDLYSFISICHLH